MFCSINQLHYKIVSFKEGVQKLYRRGEQYNTEIQYNTYGMAYATKQTIPIIWNEGDNWIDFMKIKNVVVLTESAMKRET